MNNKLVNAIALSGALGLSSAAHADDYVGIELRWNFNDSPTLGIVVRNVKFRDIKTSSTSTSNSYIDAAPTLIFNDVELGLSDPELPQVSVGDTISLNTYNVDDNMVTGTNTNIRRTSDKISGYGGGIHFPLNKDWNKPKIELKGLMGKVNSYGELGLGYNFKNSEVTVPISYSAKNLTVGTNLRHPITEVFIGLNSNKPFNKLEETITNGSTTSKQLCDGGEDEYMVVNKHNGLDVNYSFCNNF